MSERKSAEIKFRCTPTFKAGVQVAAEAAGQSMSEYIEMAVGRQSAQGEGTGLARQLGERPFETQECKGCDVCLKPVDTTPYEVLLEKISAEDEPPVDDDGSAVACTCRAWEFCTHKVVG